MARLRPIVGWVLVALTGLSGEAVASGLSFDQQGAAAAGKANAFAGEANDPSAIFYNPAGITQLPGTQVMIGTAIVYLDSVFQSSTTGESTQLQDQFPLLPHLYITHRFKNWDERLSIGLGIYTQFGLLIDWPDNWEGRFNSTNVRLRVTIFNPTIAFQATKELSVAAGIRIADAAAEFAVQALPDRRRGSSVVKLPLGVLRGGNQADAARRQCGCQKLARFLGQTGLQVQVGPGEFALMEALLGMKLQVQRHQPQLFDRERIGAIHRRRHHLVECLDGRLQGVFVVISHGESLQDGRVAARVWRNSSSST